MSERSLPTGRAAAATSAARLTNPILHEVTWRFFVGTAAGVIAGALVGGVGGRLAMLLLRLTSPGDIVGLDSDDGFQIGRISTDSLALLGVCVVAGALNGALYVTLRGGLPARYRAAIWALFAGLTGGAIAIRSDGVDFNRVEPAALSVVLFLALPVIGAVAVTVLAERWLRIEPWSSGRLGTRLVVVSVGATIALVPILGLLLVEIAVRQVRVIERAARRLGPIVVPLALAGIGAVAVVDLVDDLAAIL